jgi:hypothetical protein
MNFQRIYESKLNDIAEIGRLQGWVAMDNGPQDAARWAEEQIAKLGENKQMDFDRIYESEESAKRYKKYAKMVYKKLYDKESDKWRFNKAKDIDGWPDGLDTENCDVRAVTNEGIVVWAAGDWQDEVRCRIWLTQNERDLRIIPFDPAEKMTAAENGNKLKELEELALEDE